jgi:hypothetical membrane protein
MLHLSGEGLVSRRTQHADNDARLVLWAARGGVVGPALFVSGVVLAGMLYDGYSHTSQKISELGGAGAEFAFGQNVNFVLLGTLVIGFTWALGRTLGPRYLGARLIAVFGISSCIANGLLPCDIACVGETPVAQAHNITGVVGFLAAIAGMIVLARRWRDDPRWQHHVTATILAVSVSAAGLIWFIVTQVLDPLHPLSGVAQRTFVAALLSWIARTAWLLDRQLTTTAHERTASTARF